MNPMIRVLIVDDHRMLRQGLSALLRSEPGIQVVGEASDGHQAVELATSAKPDVVLMDISMPGLDGIDATRQLHAAGGHAKVIALSAHSQARLAIQMLRAGATGYLLKAAPREELMRAIHAVVAGGVYLTPDVAGIVVDDVVRSTGNAAPAGPLGAERLSPREREILLAIAEGLSTKEVARRLDVSVKTVETHRRNLMEKLGLDGVAQLTRFAVGEGIAPLDSPDPAGPPR